MAKRYSFLWHILMLILLLFATTSYFITPTQAKAQGGDASWILQQVNALRGQLGLHTYVWNNQLAAAAQQQAEYMATTGHISHTQANGSTPGSRAAVNGYNGSWVSENIYGGGIAQASDAWNFWINSPVHYAGIAHTRNNEIGIGSSSGPYGTMYAMVFGYRSDISAPPAPTAVAQVSASEPGGGNVAPQAPAATRRPPTRTFTPSPTIPTLTPTVTWTFTPTWTSSPTTTLVPNTSTPIKLPTVAFVVAAAPTDKSPTPVDISALPTAKPLEHPQSTSPPVIEKTSDDDNQTAALVLGGIAVLSLGLLFIGYGLYSMKNS